MPISWSAGQFEKSLRDMVSKEPKNWKNKSNLKFSIHLYLNLYYYTEKEERLQQKKSCWR